MSEVKYNYVNRQFTQQHTQQDKMNFINEIINKFPQATMQDFKLTKDKNGIEIWSFKYDKNDATNYWDPNTVIANHK